MNPHTDRNYQALIELIETVKVEREGRGVCYQLSVGMIARTFSQAGDEVTRKLRGWAQPCNMGASEVVSTPWIDFLAAGATKHCGVLVPWVAMVTSDPERAKGALKSQIETMGPGVLHCKSERCRVVSKGLTLLGVRFSPPERAPSSVPVDFSGMIDRFGLSLGGSSVLVAYFGGSPVVDGDLFRSNAGEIQYQADEFWKFCEHIHGSLRVAFGPGWFGNADGFLNALSKASESQNLIEAGRNHPACDPSVMAAAATQKLLGFGWLPSHLNNPGIHKDMGLLKKELRRDLQQEGIVYFKVPRISLSEANSLDLKNPMIAADEWWQYYQSQRKTDTPVLAIEIKAHGRQHRAGDPQRPTKKSHRRFLMIPLGFQIYWLIQRLHPEIEQNVLGYLPGGSENLRSHQLNQLVRSFVDKGDENAYQELEKVLCAIAYPTAHETDLVDLLNQKADEEARTTQDADTDTGDGSLDKKALVFLRLLDRMLSSEGDSWKHVSPIRMFFRCLAELCSIPGKDFREPSKFRNGSALGRLTWAKGIYQLVKSRNDLFDKINLTSESKYPRKKLVKELIQFAVDATHKRLEIPEFVRHWMESMTRMTWIMPLDHLNPCPVVPSAGDRVACADQRAHLHYPHLFSPVPEEGSVPVEIKFLLQHLRTELGSHFSSKQMGFLTQRISSTNALMTGLMIRLGYLPDFEMESLDNHLKPANEDYEALLLRLDSKLILRRLLEMEGGRDFLGAWCDKIRKLLLTFDSSDDSDYVSGDRRLENLFEVFEDAPGIAEAALDCCRRKIQSVSDQLHGETENSLIVYFLPAMLRENFFATDINPYKQGNSISWAKTIPFDCVKEKSDASLEGDATENVDTSEDSYNSMETITGDNTKQTNLGPTMEEVGGTTDEVDHVLALKDLLMKESMDINEACMHINESLEEPYPLLNELVQEVFGSAPPSKVFLKNCRAILEKMDPGKLKK